MANQQVMRFIAVAAVATSVSGAKAELNQQQFIEAVAMLGLNPDVAAAAGFSESELIGLYESISESDGRWAQVVAQRNAVRSALDSITADDESVAMDAVEDAQALLSSSLAAWRDLLSQPLSTAVRVNYANTVEQSSSGLPAYILVKAWTQDELSLLSKGIADQRRQQRGDTQEDTLALDFFLDALSDSEVIVAKASWDARKAVYAQRFAEQLTALD